MLRYLSADITCSEKRTVFQERSSTGNFAVKFEEQIISKDKYHVYFNAKMEANVSIILGVFFATYEV